MVTALDVSSEVDAALRAGRPVVALESTIIAHGMPWPQNVETALAVEAEIRALGAMPATIAIIDGRLKAGLERDELERVGRGGRDLAKVEPARHSDSRSATRHGCDDGGRDDDRCRTREHPRVRDGGIGGVHRGAENSLDISADLQELARTSVAVVCAGAKAILDLRLTLEYLETHGVPVIGYRTDRLPAFWSRDSGFGVDVRVDEPDDIARIMQAKWQLGLNGGLVVANPIPEPFELPRALIEDGIEHALGDARAQNVTGKALTPFLLARLNALTEGDSLASNIELVRDNARLAARIAVSYSALSAE